MSAEQLLQHFDQIVDAPDAVARLRRFILDLAMHGKLVEQNPSDEPMAEIFDIENEEMPFEIPENWVATKVGAVLNLQYGKALPARVRRDQGAVPVYGSNGVVGYNEDALAEQPAIIIGRKGSAGALNLCDGPSWTTDVAYYLIPPSFYDIHFLFAALQDLDLSKLGKGVKPGLNRTEAYQLSIVIPPLAEQHRIVAKVDELMTLCDELETQLTRTASIRRQLLEAMLHKVLDFDP